MRDVRNAITLAVLALAAFALAACGQENADGGASKTPSDLVPRDAFFARPEVSTPLLSPDGRMISAVRPLDGVQNFFVAPVDDMTKWRAITHFTDRDVNPTNVSGTLTHFWTPDSRYLVFLRDTNGNEKFHVMRADVATGEIVDLTPGENTRAVVCTRPATFLGCELAARPDNTMLVGLYGADPRFYDLYWLDIATGKTALALKNDRFIAFIADNAYEARIGITQENGGIAAYFRAPGGEWTLYKNYGPSGSPNRVINFDPENKRLRVFSADGRDKQALVELDLDTRVETVIAEDDQVDLGNALVEPGTGKIQGYIRDFTRAELVVLDPAIQEDMDYLREAVDGELAILSRSADNKRWLLRFTFADAPQTLYLYERSPRKLTRLFSLTPALEGLPLTKVHPIVTKSSDGFDLVSYYSLPRAADPDQDGKGDRPVPLIVIIHGGPSDERARWTFAPILQWLNNRGYATLYVNFRGSPGFGKRFLEAQALEWGGKMNRDVDEQVENLIRMGLVDPKRIAVFGGSYGGFATLTAITRRPDLYACAVAVVGPSNLETFIANRPPEWPIEQMAAEIGDPRTPEGRAHLKDRSPVTHAGDVKGPVLIVQGANDRRVPQSESDTMVAALKSHGVKVTYLLYPDEGHGLLRQPNVRSMFGVTEVFLGGCLGGKAEPIGDALEGASIQVKEGVDDIPGLKDALAALPAPTAVEPPAPGVLETYAGTYDLAGAGAAVTFEGGKLFIEVEGQDKAELTPKGGARFAVVGSQAEIEFKPGADGKAASFTLHSRGDAYDAARK